MVAGLLQSFLVLSLLLLLTSFFTGLLVPFEPAMEFRSRESRQLANVVTALPPLVPLPPLAVSGIVNVKIWKGVHQPGAGAKV